jgi:flagellar biosynthesis protein FlhB
VAKRDGRNLAPTPKRKRDARREGRLPRSPEIPTAVALVTTVLTGSAFVPGLLGTVHRELRNRLTDLGDGTVIPTGHILTSVSRITLAALPMILIGMVAGVTAVVAQGGVVVGSKMSKPSLKNLSLKRGLSKLNPKQAGPVLLKSVAKIAALTLAAWGPGRKLWSAVQAGRSMSETLGRTGDAVKSFLWTSALLLSLIAVIDYVHTRRKLGRDLKMTRQEVTDESKMAEGDPKMKAARKRKAFEISRRRGLPPIALADVIVTNPTHYAVALFYDEGSPAPRVVAKGVNRAAARIRREAARHGVPIIEHRPLARALHRQCKVGAYIPAALFDEVVGVLVTAYWRRGRFPAFLAGRKVAS